MTQWSTDSNADERSTLASFLRYVRAVTAAKLDGIGDDLACRKIAPSGLSLVGIVQHLTDLERRWFQQAFLGDDLGIPWSVEDPDGDVEVAAPATVAGALAAYATACDRSTSILEAHDLDATAALVPDSFDGAVVTLRWIGWHVVEQTSRHNGHLDLLRAQLDGRTGDL